MRAKKSIHPFLFTWAAFTVVLLLAVLGTDQLDLHRIMHAYTSLGADRFFATITHLADGLVPTALSVILLFMVSMRAFLMMGLNGLFALLAATGGLLYILIVVGSVLFGEKRTEAVAKANPVIFDASTVKSYGSEEHPKLSGTYVLVAIFFVAFVLYYYVNWKFLSEVWPLS